MSTAGRQRLAGRACALATALSLGLSAGPVWAGEDPERPPSEGSATVAGEHWREGQFIEIEAPPSPGEAKDGEAKDGEGGETLSGDAGLVEPPPPSLQPVASGDAEIVRVAVGLAAEFDGARSEIALLDRLEGGIDASPAPVTETRRLRVGSAESRAVCREGRDDLVIVIGSLPDREEPVLLTRDCLLDLELGIRALAAADDPGLVGVLWAEHHDAVAQGASARRRIPMSPKLRTGLIAGVAVVIVGAAVGLLIAGAVNRESVVIRVSPQ